jgi:hypothetical protein
LEGWGVVGSSLADFLGSKLPFPSSSSLLKHINSILNDFAQARIPVLKLLPYGIYTVQLSQKSEGVNKYIKYCKL